MQTYLYNTLQTYLPDAMLRDVLVANPQSAKSGNVMQALDERIVPMPDEMKEEVQEGINVFASYDNMLGNLALWTDRWSTSFTGLARIFSNDTLITRATDSLVALYASTNTLEAKYRLALIETARGNATLAQQTLASIPTSFPLTNDEMAQQADYTDIINQSNALMQSDPYLLSADSTSIAAMLPLAAKDNFLPGAMARNILHAAGYLQYTEPVNLNASLKAAKVKNPDAMPDGNKKFKRIGLELYPNPAADYCIVHFTCITDGTNYLQIFNVKGQPIEKIRLKGTNNYLVLSLKQYTCGSYLISLVENGSIIESTQLIVK